MQIIFRSLRFLRLHIVVVAGVVAVVGASGIGLLIVHVAQHHTPSSGKATHRETTHGGSGATCCGSGTQGKNGAGSPAKSGTGSGATGTGGGATPPGGGGTTTPPVILPPAPQTPTCAAVAYSVACHPWVGAATYTTTSGSHLSWASFQAQGGSLQARRSYLDPSTTVPSSFAASPAGPDVANNDVTFFSMKLDPGAFSSGALDSQFNNFLASIPAGHQTYLTYWHEPEDDIANGTVVGSTALTLANWKASVNHMGQLIHATHRSELHNMIILQGPWTFYSGGYGNTDYWDSGFDANLDSLGLDIYASSTSGGFTNYASIPSKLGYSGMMNFLNTHFISQGKTWGITEIGAHEEHPSNATAAQIASEDQQKAQWIADSWAWAKTNHAISYLYFNYNATAGLPDSQSNIIAAGSSAESVFRQIVTEANQ